ncbi:histidine phosphatase family protein [Salidesulfovibrio brasiliensis]|uniref:histidine phosphatase family protein n=1 Tax=Salidesulfovibrio brasiliensis TaxID=221711 RepID=UPI001FDF5059|nr:histidine phosphatase family protein [Salidesulfovibrio brasiliensis]
MRHARTEGGEGCCIGRTTLKLSKDGARQAVEAAEELRDCGFARLGCSPSLRACDTVAPLAGRMELDPVVMPGLDEIDMGAWDGLTFSEIRERFPRDYELRGKDFAGFKPLNGESFNEVADRAVSALERSAAGPLPLLAVTHAGVIRAVLCRLTGHPMNKLFDYTPGHLECSILKSTPTGLSFVATGLQPAAVRSFFCG